MSEETQPGGYEHDLREAENAMAAAGYPDIALGMRRHSEAQRNMMQGVLVPMFVTMVERSLKAMIAPLIVSQKETQDAIGALGVRFRAVEQDMQTLTTRVDGLSLRLDRKRSEIDRLNEEVRDLRGDMLPVERARLTRILLRMIAEWEVAHPDEAQRNDS